MPFATEPPRPHAPAERTAVILCNLGTPDEPTPAALRRYLAEFLGDPRVVEIPRLLWWPILYGVILRVRPAKSAAKYQSIWMPDGSPLKVWTERQAKRLLGHLGERGQSVLVRYAMRYGKPSIATVLDEVKAQGATRVLVLSAYPQYSGTTTASVIDAVGDWSATQRAVPELRFVNGYHDDPGYIDALARSVRQHWQANGRADKLVMSFHGVPERTRTLGDPYHDECQATGRALAQALGLSADQFLLTFQSRFGKAKWLEPYTEPSLIQLAGQGVKSVDLICPGFTSDCIETLEEIDMEARAAFLKAGGERFAYIPCLNDREEWIRALGDIALRHLQGWPTRVQAPVS
ncbi:MULTISPECIES: ferrochelatase [Hydrogenophaga]|uniref:Ferrochelatase n=1 Tax=Hydrogenophaga intermedia TaxID=65786 RepID=A0A1L1PM95_HYDIT|nr:MULTISPECIES: ferrochelatase [Hydrogenophaga]AOS78819.1 ferrochelatase [Hydrogenophaga sp. PBC]TMU71330.1 ferrochelatase [Hydrogenophaga intermedia]CDN88903.1 Ferrochelatase [Hydrogenophaga intermedia]